MAKTDVIDIIVDIVDVFNPRHSRRQSYWIKLLNRGHKVSSLIPSRK